MARSTSVAIVLLIVVAGCTVESDTSPPRPAGLPADAGWVGGADGGVFVRMMPEGSPGTYAATIYYPDGEIRHQGRFVATGAAAPTSPVTPADLAGFDGTQLLLKQGGSLVAQPSTESQQKP